MKSPSGQPTAEPAPGTSRQPSPAASTQVPGFILALLKRAVHPAGAPAATLVETHISWVLLAGEFAYKIKKPLKLPFLDFSTPALRKQYCEDELRLNRRFAPDIYLDVIAITGAPESPGLGGKGPVIDYAVRMRRFDDKQRLDRVCGRGELRFAHLSELARSVVAFHAAAAIAPTDSHFGSPAQVLAPAMDNFRDLAQLLTDQPLLQRLARLRDWTAAEHQRLAPLMQQRKASGRVRECHGDLHLANMVLLDGHVRMFDCLEFNEELRWLDTGNEIAFTYVDLLDHGQAGLANWFINETISHSGDHGAVAVLRFYAVYRAMVRAKVAAIRHAQSQDPQENQASRICIAQAEQLVAPVAQRLVITHGLAGCGKTVASTRLLQTDAHARTLRVRSDVERKRLFGLAHTARSGSDTGAGIYTPDAHQQTYRRLAELATSLLQTGWSVVVDAAFLKRQERDAFRALARSHGAQFAILAPQAEVDVLRQRIQARQLAGQDASEATVDVLDRQLQWIEPLAPEEMAQRLAPDLT